MNRETIQSPSPNDTGSFYAFAGIDGSGKTTLINSLSSELRIAGHDVFISKAYTPEHKDAFSQFIETADDIEIMFMFQAFQRRQRNNILARLALGSVVLADRWNETFEAYHSQNGDLSNRPSLRAAIDDLTVGDLRPAKTFYLRIKPSVAMRRTHSRGADFFDVKTIDYHQAQADYYDKRADEDDSWITIDAHRTPADIMAYTLNIIRDDINS